MDVINVINIATRQDRILSVCNEMRIQQAPFRIWNGVTDKLTTAQNINAAHKQIVSWAKENNIERVVIAEDDILFSHHKSYQYFLSNIPGNYDLFMGMIYAGEIQDNKIVNGFSGLTLYCVNSRFYDKFLAIQNDLHLDRALGMTAHENEYYVCPKFICKQSGSYSDNMRKSMDYSQFEKNMIFFDGTGYD